MTPHRSDLEAAHARIAALERELAEARAKARRSLVCTACQAHFQLEDLVGGVLTCRECGAALEIGRPPPARARRDCPRDVEVDAGPAHFRVWWRWQRPWSLVVFCLLATIFAATLSAEAGDTQVGAMWAALAFLGGAASAVAAYDYLAHRINRTEIEVTASRIIVRHGPLPYRPRIELLRERIAQLYVEPRREDGVTYALVAVETSGGRVPLVRLASVTRAFYLEQQLESRLGIDDRPVAGEQPRS